MSLAKNPFYVLGLRPSASRAELEREGQKLLGMLELGLAAAAQYQTPCGPEPRSADQVRQALALLRDPQRRLLQELWAQLDSHEPVAPDPAAGEADAAAPALPPWPGALSRLGF